MDLSKLDLLSTAALQALRDRAQDILTKRNANTLRHGAIGWFKDRIGQKRFIRIIRVNAKTVTGIEVDGTTFMDTSVGRGMTWRVSPMLLNIIDTSAKANVAPTPAVPHRPSTSGMAW